MTFKNEKWFSTMQQRNTYGCSQKTSRDIENLIRDMLADVIYTFK